MAKKSLYRKTKSLKDRKIKRQKAKKTKKRERQKDPPNSNSHVVEDDI